MATTKSKASDSARTSRRASPLAGLILLLLGLLLPLLGLEGVLRVFGPVLPGRYSSGLYQESHPTYGRFQIPNTDGWYRTDEFVTRVAFNSLGLREREVPVPKPAQESRVLFLGDSFVQATEVAADATLTRRVEQDLAQAGRQIYTIDAGVGGFSTDQELLLVRDLGPKVQPDLVVLVFYLGNDVTENSNQLTRYLKPYFTLDANGSLQPTEFHARARSEEGISERLRRDSRLYSVLDTGVFPKLRTLPGFSRIFRADPDGATPIPIGAGPGGSGVYVANLPPLWEDAWKLTDVLLAAVRDETKRQGVPLLIVSAPTKWEVYNEDWTSLLQQNKLPADDWDLDGPNRRLHEIAQRQGVPFLDLRPALQKAATDHPRLYFRQDVHWTPEGHRVVGDAISEYLIGAGSALLPSRP